MPPTHGMLDVHLRRAAITVWLTRHATEAELKQQLAAHTYFGRGAHNAEDAAYAYFQQSLDTLSPEQIAWLAAVTTYPSASPERVLRRRDWILAKLRDAGRTAAPALAP